MQNKKTISTCIMYNKAATNDYSDRLVVDQSDYVS